MSTETLTTGRAAQLIGISRSQMLRLLRSGEITPARESTGPHDPYLVTIEELRRYQAKREAKILNAPINQAGPLSRAGKATALADTKDGAA